MGATATSKNRVGIYKRDQIFDGAIKRLQSATDICENNKANIIRLVEHLLARGVSKPRAVKYINHLTVLARTAGKPFEQLKGRDIERLIYWVNTANYTDYTKHDYKIILKKFYQWLRGCSEEEHEYPEEVKWIKTALRRRRLLPEALLTWKRPKGLLSRLWLSL